MKTNLILNKNFIFLGSSVTYGVNNYSFVEALKNNYKINILLKDAVSGTTLVDKDDMSYISRLKRIDLNLKPDFFIVQLSTNDASLNLTLGNISNETNLESFNTSTILGSVEYIIKYIIDNFNIVPIFYTGAKFDSLLYKKMVDLLYLLKNKWNIGIIDLFNDEEMNIISSDLYKTYMIDSIHPSIDGYNLWWCPKFFNLLNTYILDKDNQKLKEYWNNEFKSLEPKAINEKIILTKDFNEIIKEYIKEDSAILDFGCGSGWALIETYNSLKFKKGIGIDTSINAINYLNKVKDLSNIKNLLFINSEQNILDNYKDYFDFIMSFNVLDVVNDEIVDSILNKMYNSLKLNSHIFIGMNYNYSIEELKEKFDLENNGCYFFKDNILRLNKKKILEWEIIFSKYFKVIDSFEFYLNESEKEYPRMGYILYKNN